MYAYRTGTVRHTGDELADLPACFSVRCVPLLRFENTCSVLCTAERCASCVDPALKNTVLAFWRVLEATRRTYILLIVEQCYRGGLVRNLDDGTHAAPGQHLLHERGTR